MSQDLPKNIKSFKTQRYETVPLLGGDEIATITKGISKLRLDDISWRIGARKWYGFLLLLLLFVQNGFVFGMTLGAFLTNRLAPLQLIFAILIPATLLETAYTIKTIVEWLFRDIDYTVKKDQHGGLL